MQHYSQGCSYMRNIPGLPSDIGLLFLEELLPAIAIYGKTAREVIPTIQRDVFRSIIHIPNL